jgi:FkbM family methyltransferase
MRSRLFVGYLRAPEHPGKLRVVRALSRLIPETGVVARVAHGLQLHLHPRDWIEYLLLRGTPYEPLTLDFMRANLEHQDAALLAGVNFGLHLAVAAQAVGRHGRVIGVEPQPAAILRARLNLRLNDLEPQVELVAAALGDAQQLTPMAWSNPDNPGAASLLDRGHGLLVPMIRLQDVLHRLEARRFRLLLLDVQGYELQALGGIDLRQGPDIAIVELDPEFLARTGTAAEEVVAPLLAAGYRLHDLHGHPISPPITDLPERNLIAVRAHASVRWDEQPS